jgi:hypothetical protein
MQHTYQRNVFESGVRKSERKRPAGSPSVDGRIILKWLLRTWRGKVWYEFYLVQDRDEWWDLVKIVKIKKQGISQIVELFMQDSVP